MHNIREWIRSYRLELLIAALVFFSRFVFYHSPNWNQAARLAPVLAFVEPGTPYTGTFKINHLKDGPRLFTGDWASYQGDYFSNKAPGSTVLAIPAYFLLYHGERLAGIDPTDPHITWVNTYILSLWTCALWTLIATLALLNGLPRLGLQSRQGAVGIALTYAFATLVFPFDVSFWGHSVAAAFLLLGILQLLRDESKQYAWAGFWLGCAVFTEYLTGLTFGLAGLWILLRKDPIRKATRFALGAALPVALLLLYHKMCFDSFFTTSTSLSNPMFIEPHKVGGFYSLPMMDAILGNLVLPSRGIFLHMPVLLFALVGAAYRYWLGQRGLVVFCMAIFLATVLVLSSFNGWMGGHSSGARYFIMNLPVLCLLFPDPSKPRFVWAFRVLFAISAFNMFAIAATSSTFAGPNPLYGEAYPSLLWGTIAMSPPLQSPRFIGLAILIAIMVALYLIFSRFGRAPKTALSSS